VLRNAVNIGKGAALKLGLNFALTRFRDLRGIVTADADGQHRLKDIVGVANQLAATPHNLVLGVRTFGAGTPMRSLIGNTISQIVYRLLLGVRLSDTQTGLRGIPKAFAEECLAIRSNRYEFETEQLALIGPKGNKVAEIPIETVYENNNASSHFDPFFDSFRIYFIVLRYAFSSIVTSLVDLVVFGLVLSLSGSVMTSNLAARMVALGLQFQLLKSFVFQSRAGLLKLVSFVAYVMIMGLISGVLQEALTSYVGIGALPAKPLIETLMFIFNFLFLRTLLFREVDK
jgi:GtrA-like protein